MKYEIKTLRGDVVTDSIEFRNGVCSIDQARWGMKRGNNPPLLISPKHARRYQATVKRAAVKRTQNDMLVLCASPGVSSEYEIVLVQEYSPGVGAKRWPSFGVALEEFDDVTVLSRDNTVGGSGQETWSLVKAPSGWAAQVARAFVNQRDEPGQTITPDAVHDSVCGEHCGFTLGDALGDALVNKGN